MTILANHVIHIPFQQTLTCHHTPSLSKEEEKNQTLITISGNVLKSSHGCIISTCCRTNILYSKLVYNAHGQCTHLVLYLEQDIDPVRK